MQIKIEELTTQRIINFYPAENIKMADKLIVTDRKRGSNNALLQNITEIDGVERCLAAEDILSVKYGGEDTADIKALILAELDDFMTANTALQSEKNLSTAEYAEALADALIRPTLNRDNGDIMIHAVTADTIELSFTGHCAGCPYAQNTLQNVVARTFTRYMPQIKEIKLKG